MGKMKTLATGIETATPVAVAISSESAAPQQSPFADRPTKFTYALARWTVERRADGWHIGKTAASGAGQRPRYEGGFDTVENTCLAISNQSHFKDFDRSNSSHFQYI